MLHLFVHTESDRSSHSILYRMEKKLEREAQTLFTSSPPTAGQSRCVGVNNTLSVSVTHCNCQTYTDSLSILSKLSSKMGFKAMGFILVCLTLYN